MKFRNLLGLTIPLVFFTSSFAKCASDEVTVFSGSTGNKEVSICGVLAKGEFAQLEYRFGPAGNPEFKFLVDGKSKNRFNAMNETCSPKASTNNIWFQNGDFTYLVSECSGRNCEFDGGVMVLRGKKIIAKIMSKPDSSPGFGFTEKGPDFSGAKNGNIFTKTSLIASKELDGISACSLYEGSSAQQPMRQPAQAAQAAQPAQLAQTAKPAQPVQPVQPVQPLQQPTVTQSGSASVVETEVRKMIFAECKLDKVGMKKNPSANEVKAATDEFRKVTEEVGNKVDKFSQDQKDEFLIFFKVVRDQTGKCENPVFDRKILEAGKVGLRNLR